MNNETKRWYCKDLGNGQGLVIEETTGRDVAVTYRAEDAPLVAQAPDLARRAALADGLAELMRAAVLRVQIANDCGDTILSAWMPDALAALAAYDAEKGGKR